MILNPKIEIVLFLAKDTVHLLIIQLCMVGSGKSLYGAVIRYRYRIPPPSVRSLQHIRDIVHGIHIAHFGVAVKLNPLS